MPDEPSQIGLEDFFQAMKQLYPDQTARVIAELRAQKAEAQRDQLAEHVRQLEAADE